MFSPLLNVSFFSFLLQVIKRVMDRDGVSEEAAQMRLEAQISNAERVRYANVIFSTQWEPEYTQKQVNK